MSRPSSRTSSQRSSAWRSRGWVTAAPSCQNVPARSSRSPIARIFSISSGVSSIDWRQRSARRRRSATRRAIRSLVSSFCFLSRLISTCSAGVRERRRSSMLDLLVEAAMFGGQFSEESFLRDHGLCAHASSACSWQAPRRYARSVGAATSAALASAPGTPSGYFTSASDGRMYVGAPAVSTSTPAARERELRDRDSRRGPRRQPAIGERREQLGMRDDRVAGVADGASPASPATQRASSAGASTRSSPSERAVDVDSSRRTPRRAAHRATATITPSRSDSCWRELEWRRGRARRATTPPTAGGRRRTRCPWPSPSRCAAR